MKLIIEIKARPNSPINVRSACLAAVLLSEPVASAEWVECSDDTLTASFSNQAARRDAAIEAAQNLGFILESITYKEEPDED